MHADLVGPARVYGISATGLPPTERPDINWPDVIRRVPRAPVLRLTVQDLGDRWGCLYDPIPRQQARRMAQVLADGMRSFRPGQLH
jgi:hypothetical protein